MMLFLNRCSKHMRQLCIADRHCFQLCIAMLETPCSVASVYMHALHVRHCMYCCAVSERLQQGSQVADALHSRQASLSAVHCSAGGPCCVACVNMHSFICCAC